VENWVNQFSDELYCWAFYKPLQKDRQDLVQETFVGFS
jgi:RNA polymerase sigma-70 factor (ECF subfamily)